MHEEGPAADAPLGPFRLAERYDVLQLLGRGGMASVYRARDDATGNTVAPKVLAVDKGSHAVRIVELFEREFRTLVQLAHPRIVRAYDYGVDGGQLALLRDGDPPTRGHLYTSTPSGFTLAASNMACHSVTAFTSFARRRVERERAAQDIETDALYSEPAGTMTGEWQDVDGTSYEGVLLGVVISGMFCIAGIALLVSGQNVVARTSGAVAEAVARALIEAGDAAVPLA